ncbi:hypothetical protein SSU0522 [Streptococcus suis P1/7]|nr:hypothetical protein SSU0522 [Streptococcus suis P1/7]
MDCRKTVKSIFRFLGVQFLGGELNNLCTIFRKIYGVKSELMVVAKKRMRNL